jgi:hypothetical protein
VYIPSKSRADIAVTPRVLEQMGVPSRLIVEEQQYRAYRAMYPADRLLVLPPSYQDAYETGDDVGREKSLGPGPARNFAWDHSRSEGHAWHWVMDDNINCFGRLHRNARRRVGDGMVLAAMEDFCLRYVNVGMAGPEYRFFLPSRDPRRDPFTLNRRIFSCNLIRNDTMLRWRGRYNEDLDLSIMMLRAGWCTVKFCAFYQEKRGTQTMPGGNMEEFYGSDGTLEKSQLAVAMHPDIVKLVRRYGRWHHEADFSEFDGMNLLKDPEWKPPVRNPYRVKAVPNPRFRQRLNPSGATQLVNEIDPEHARRGKKGS